jgi:hypothetical protein
MIKKNKRKVNIIHAVKNTSFIVNKNCKAIVFLVIPRYVIGVDNITRTNYGIYRA